MYVSMTREILNATEKLKKKKEFLIGCAYHLQIGELTGQ